MDESSASLEEYFRTVMGLEEFVSQRAVVAACDAVIASNFFTARNLEHFGFTSRQLSASVPDRDAVVMTRFRDGGLERTLEDCARHPDNRFVIVQTLIGDDGRVEQSVLSRIPGNVVALFSKNVYARDPRVIAMPIGLDWRAVETGVDKTYRRFAAGDRLVYVNLSVETGPRRPLVARHFRKFDWATVRTSPRYGQNALPYPDYLDEMSRHGFCASPDGKALDQYRTWDALYCKSIPLIERNTHSAAWEDLPVVFVNDWDQVDQRFLAEKLEELSTRRFDLQLMTARYWRNRFRRALE